MSAFAVGTPPRNHNNTNNHQRLKNNVIYNDKENTVNYYERRNSNRGRTSSSFDGEIRRRQDHVYHSTPERSGSKHTPSPESRSRALRRSPSVMAYSPTRQANNSTLVGGKRVSAPSPQQRSQTYASMEEMFANRGKALNDIGNTRSFDENAGAKKKNNNTKESSEYDDGTSQSSSDYIVDALSRRKKKNNSQLMVRWILDRDCLICFQCNEPFSMIKRRHHCRACGGIFCAGCSRWRKKLPHLGYTDSDARVCKWCYEDQYLAEKLNVNNNEKGFLKDSAENDDNAKDEDRGKISMIGKDGRKNSISGESRIIFTKVAPKWVDDYKYDNCQQCAVGFGLFVRKHHCRGCGALTCHACTLRKISMPEFGYLTPVRACIACSSPKILSTTKVKTSGGIIEITGRNLGTNVATIQVEAGTAVAPCSDVEVLVPGHKLRCRVPPGVGAQNQLRVTVCKLTGVGTYAYEKPNILETTSVYTRGGELTVTGDNFGTDAELLLIEWLNTRSNNWADATSVELLVPHRIFKCHVGSGVGTHAMFRVTVASQGVQGTFSYLPPQILEITPISAAGGAVDIVGLNFGRTPESVSVQVEGVTCNNVKIVVPHTKISCIVPRCPRVNGNDKKDKSVDKYSYHSRRHSNKGNNGRSRSNSENDLQRNITVHVQGQNGVGQITYINEEQMEVVKFAKNVSQRQYASKLTPTAAERRRHVLEKAPWQPSENVLKCMLCEGAFGWINRKHHCRNCGIVVCGHCSSNKQYIAAYQSMQRVCKKCFRVILSDTEEMEVLYAEMEHVSALRSVEIGKKVQLEQQLSLLRLQNGGATNPEVERLEALLLEQERRSDGKQVRYDQLHARLRQLQNVLDGKASRRKPLNRDNRLMRYNTTSSRSNNSDHNRSKSALQDSPSSHGKYDDGANKSLHNRSSSSPALAKRTEKEENGTQEMDYEREAVVNNEQLSTPPSRKKKNHKRRASSPLIDFPRAVLEVAKEEQVTNANQVLESSGLLRGRALSDYALHNYSQSPVRSWVGAAKETLSNNVVYNSSSSGRHTRRTPVWVRRMQPPENSQDYTSNKDLTKNMGNSSLIVAKFKGSKCVLKEMPMADDQIRKQIEREVAVRGMFRPPLHPAIAPLDAVFYDKNTARMYMHYQLEEVGTMADWLQAGKPKAWDIQSVFQQLLSAIAYIHSHQISHRRLNLETVYVGIVGDATGELARPFVSDFSGALVALPNTSRNTDGSGTKLLDISNKKTMNGADERKSKNNEEGSMNAYLAPEVIANGGINSSSNVSTASDLWSIGVMLYKATFGLSEEPVALGGVHAPIPETKNPRLRELLASLLRVNPQERLTAQACTAHPYFTVSFAREMHESGNIISTEEKISTFRNYLDTFDRPDAVQFLRVRRQHLVDDVLDKFKKFKCGHLQKRLIVMYENEPGVDAGGLTKDMYCRFFERLMSPKKGFFECVESGGGRAATSARGRLYLPSGKKPGPSLESFEALGKVLAKVVFDGQTIVTPFPESFFKCLLGLSVSFRDLEDYDPQLYRQLYANVLNKQLTVEYAQALSLDFYGLVSNGEKRIVTDSNKREYLKLVSQKKLVVDRGAQFQAIVKGFSVFKFRKHMTRFNAKDLIVLLSGPAEITADMILMNMNFRHGNWRNSSTIDMIKRYIRSMNTQQRMKFLQFATGSPSLPLGGLGQRSEEENPSMGRITFTRLPKSKRLPEAHTCFNCIDLPDYMDYELLKKSFDTAIDGYAQTFDLL